jgi:hypothetical protein
MPHEACARRSEPADRTGGATTITLAVSGTITLTSGGVRPIRSC